MSAFEETVDPAIRVRNMGGRLLVAGGAVRDLALFETGRVRRPFPGADTDAAVFGLDLQGILEALSPLGPSRLVWRREGDRGSPKTAFVQLKLGGIRIECGTARSGIPGEPAACPAGSLLPAGGPFSERALVRDAELRDFTANALYFDPLEGRFLDPLGGMREIESGFLKPCSARSLADDPVRMLRAMSLVSRRPFVASAELLDRVRPAVGELDRACPERFWREWRILAESPRPHLGLHFLDDSGLISRFPALEALKGLDQYRRFHPEGSVWNHTVLVVQAIARLPVPRGSSRAVLTLTALLHDAGKPMAARARDAAGTGGPGHPLYPDHAALGAPVAREFLKSIHAPDRVARAVVKLTFHHMDLAFRTMTACEMRALARELAPEADLADLWAIVAADWNGRSPWPERFPSSLGEFLEPVRGEAGPPKDLVTGGDLLRSFGIPEGPEVGRLLRRLRTEHDEGRVETREEALEFLKGILGLSPVPPPGRGTAGEARA
jgi:tRNA nucleotidyltransferase/poly(A) polymerase